jgi:hypothetical protein
MMERGREIDALRVSFTRFFGVRLVNPLGFRPECRLAAPMLLLRRENLVLSGCAENGSPFGA